MSNLLTDEFQEFAQKIAKLHAEKKKKRAELKTLYEEFQSEFKRLDDEAARLEREFHEASQRSGNTGGDEVAENATDNLEAQEADGSVEGDN